MYDPFSRRFFRNPGGLAPLAERDLALYLQSLRSEWVAHAARLKAAGWRKAQAT